jgi:hypothetical protein
VGGQRSDGGGPCQFGDCGQPPPPQAPLKGIGRSLANTHVGKLRGKQYVDLQNDVTARDIEMAVQENYRSVEHLKRYTTTGMGTDQGKTSNVDALLIVAERTGRTPADAGTTKFRPPFAPISMGVIAGKRNGALFQPSSTDWPPSQWQAAERSMESRRGSVGIRSDVNKPFSTRMCAMPLPGLIERPSVD